jgi:hypothetical protein
MRSLNWLTTREIRAIFAEEMTVAGGTVADTFDDGSRLFLRAVLPTEREVRPGDRLLGGVALRATHEEIWVHPYVFRRVCSNGAIRAHASESLHLEQIEFPPGATAEVADALRRAVHACCAGEAFERGAAEMRSSLQSSNFDLLLTMMPLMSSLLSHGGHNEVFRSILDRFFAKGHDQSRFGLMNAVTSVARDTRDPEVRWQLEEFGGGIPAEFHASNHRPFQVRQRVLLMA